ncbi:MAG: SsrA-binding protein SmpB [Desulfovibrio sp.]|jgi:SsrA-binding protein|nr:SsrA-binding protein SmpB [Desulfovibrio sp.]
MSGKEQPSLIAKNRKAGHDFEFLEFVEAGIVLTGSEIKSIRAGGTNFHDAYVRFRGTGAFVVGLHVAPYENAGYAGHDPDRERALLLHAREMRALAAAVTQKGLSVVPVNLHFRSGRVKVELALARGRKAGDQRQHLKEAAALRDAAREMSGRD